MPFPMLIDNRLTGVDGHGIVPLTSGVPATVIAPHVRPFPPRSGRSSFPASDSPRLDRRTNDADHGAHADRGDDAQLCQAH